MYCNIIVTNITKNINSFKFPNRYRMFNDKAPLPILQFKMAASHAVSRVGHIAVMWASENVLYFLEN
jgi:hypothetical protein